MDRGQREPVRKRKRKAIILAVRGDMGAKDTRISLDATDHQALLALQARYQLATTHEALRFALRAWDLSPAQRTDPTDAQERKELRHTRTKLRQFTERAVHDLQGPLFVVTAALELLSLRGQDTQEAEATKFLDYAGQGVQQLRAVIKKLHAASQGSAQETSPTRLPPDPPRPRRKDERIALMLPLRLTSGLGAVIPAVLLNLSPTGLLALVDTRSSPLLPPPPGSRFTGEFFLDEVELRDVAVEVVRVEQRDTRQLALGCTLMARPKVRAALRGKIAAYLAASPSQGNTREL